MDSEGVTPKTEELIQIAGKFFCPVCKNEFMMDWGGTMIHSDGYLRPCVNDGKRYKIPQALVQVEVIDSEEKKEADATTVERSEPA